MIADACILAGRATHVPRLLAVSKTKSEDEILSVYQQGQREFGENYVEELIAKATHLHHLEDIRWVFIGQLQSNKIKKLVQNSDEIQSVASEKHARYIQRYCQEFGKRDFPVWIHVNAADEEQKYGVEARDVPRLGDFIVNHCPNLDLQGIMAIPPAKYSDEHCRSEPPPLYLNLSALARTIGKGQLSLGMSADLRIAIAAGSDCVRVGTAIFGQRSKV